MLDGTGTSHALDKSKGDADANSEAGRQQQSLHGKLSRAAS
jgi:hypothetical protein